jgi:hypothetical protein
MMFLGRGTHVPPQAGVGVMNVVLDRHSHGTQSLLQPGLAAFQGPALCIGLEGGVPPPPQIMALHGLTLLRILCVAAMYGPNVQFCMPNWTLGPGVSHSFQ